MSGSVETCTRLRAKAIRISLANFHCNSLTTVEDIQDYASLIFDTQYTYVNLCFRQKVHMA